MTLPKEDIQAIDQLNKEAWEIVRTNPKRTLELSKEAKEKSQRINYQKGIAFSVGNFGAAYTWLSDYEAALKNCFESIELLKILEEKAHEAQIQYYLSIIFYFLSDEEKQVRHAQISFDIAKEIGDVAAQANALNGLGTSYYSNGKNEQAIEVLTGAEKLALDCNETNLLARIYDGLGNAHTNSGNYEMALKFMNQSLDLVEKTRVKQTQSYTHDGIGNIYRCLKDYDKALAHYQISLDLRDEMGFKDGMGKTMLHIAGTYREAENQTVAIAHYEKALQIGVEIESNELIYKSNEGLSEIYEELGNTSLFVKHFKSFHLAKQAFLSENVEKRIKAVELKGKLDQIEKEKKELERKNSELESYFKDVQTLSSIGHEITSTLDIEAIFNIIYERINTLMEAHGIFIGLCNYEENKLQVKLAIDRGKRDIYFEYGLDERRIANYVVKERKSIHIDDYQEEIKHYFEEGEELLHRAPESVIIIPLEIKGDIIGVLYAQSDQKKAFSEHHFNILKSFSSYISIALDNAQLYEGMDEKVQSRTSELEKIYLNTELLNKIGQELISTLNFEDVFERLYRNVNQLMDATIFGVRLYNSEENCVDYLFEYENDRRLGIMRAEMEDDNNYSVVCIKKNEPIVINDNLIEYKKWVDEIVVLDGEMPNSLIFYPLQSSDQVLGVISIQSFEKNAYSEYHLSIVRTLAQYTSIALQNARNFEVMENKVAERTSEIRRALADSEQLSQISKEIASELSVHDIINKVYNNVNQLMDASVFGIGIYRESENDLYFSGVMEEAEKLADFTYSLEEQKISTICFLQGEEIIINDWNKEYRKYLDQDYDAVQGEMPESMIYIPLISKQNKIGVLTVQSFHKNSYDSHKANMLRTLSINVAAALENAGLYESMEERVVERTKEIEQAYQNTKLLGQISKDIAASLEIETIISSVYENINSLMDATCFGIGIYDPDRQRISMPGFIEKAEKMPEFGYELSDDRLATYCFNNAKEIVISNYFEEYHKYIKSVQKPVSGQDSTSIIYIPLFLKEKIVGLLTVQSFEENAYTDYHLDILRNIATTIGAAIENARLYENMEDKVRERTAELREQKDIIEEKNKHITDSIVYAKRIQDATLPSIGKVRNYLNDSFVLFKPKDIVSGDFYWIEEVDDIILFSVVDCTGHGVPGAFLSLIGHNSLNQIVNELGITQPADILYELDKIVYRTLQNNLEKTNIKDGMDMSIVAFNKVTNQLTFSGAFNPLYLIIDGELIEIKGDKIAIGSGQTEQHYRNHQIQLKKGDCLYLFSDGYADQFGGPKGKKFKYAKFKELLIQFHEQPMMRQHDILDMTIDDWQGDLEQLDDVCVIGMRV